MDKLFLEEALPKEMARIKKLAESHDTVAKQAGIAATFMKQDIEYAQNALMTGDIHRMKYSYKTLCAYTDEVKYY